MDYKLLQSSHAAAPSVKVMINIGAGLDITTGTFLECSHGEWVLNGGIATQTGTVGKPNMFKSTFERWQMLTGMSRMRRSTAGTYDTEINIQEWHQKDMIARIPEFLGEDVLESGRWVITDKTMYSGDEWYAKQKDWLKDKIKYADKIKVTTPFWTRGREGLLQIPLPTFSEIDSFSEFETKDVEEMQKVDLGDSKANTIHMRQGLAKTRFMMEAARLNASAYNYLFMSAHLGMETMMQNAGPAGQVPMQKLKHLKNGEKIKGTTDKWLYNVNNCWHVYNCRPMLSSSKTPEYPRDAKDDMELSTDLNEVFVRNLRSKSGISGMSQVLVVSQTEGVLPALTEFHYIKEMDKFGIEGNNTSYALCLLPDVKLMRTTVRGKIDADPMLCRAVNITSELCQMHEYMYAQLGEALLCTPKQLYDDLKAKGYDWNVLLATRGWWTYDNDKQVVPFLSTLDLLHMRVGKYVPYWLAPEEVPAGAKADTHKPIYKNLKEKERCVHENEKLALQPA